MGKKKSQPVYQRVLLKLSGEALQGNHASGIDLEKLNKISAEIANVVNAGAQIAIVIGGGNLIRGSDLYNHGFDRVTADQMGILATIINGLALRDALLSKKIPVNVFSACAVPGLVDIFDRTKAKKALDKGKVVIFVGGTGNPLVTTDSAAALRGIETGVDLIAKATKVDGVFAADPVKNPTAKQYKKLTYDEVLQQRLGVMDLNAILLCKDHRLPLRVFNMTQPNALMQIIQGEEIGTIIQGGE